MRAHLILASVVALLLDCASLDKLPSDTCGNGVVDAQEDCDTFPAGQCGEPTAGDAKCRLKCGKQPGGEALACPEGWGCSVAGFCRQPTGAFEAAGEPLSAGVTTMLVGDFDGDGKKDVLGSSGPTSKGRIHYFNGASAPQVVALPGVLAAPVIYDFDGDGRSDIAFGYTFRSAREVAGLLESQFAGGYAILLGQPDRAVVPKLFPTFTAVGFDALIVELDAEGSEVPTSAVGDPVLAVATFDSRAGVRTTVLTSLDGDPTDIGAHGYMKPLPGSIADLAGEPIVARVFDGLAASACGEVVVPYKSGRILVFSPCARSGASVGWAKDAAMEITVPGETISRVFVARVDEDVHPDLIVGTTLASGAAKVRVAYGTGVGFEPVTDAPTDLVEVPLASGLLDRDLRVDFVVPSGVLLSSRKSAKDLDAGASLDGGVPPTPRASLSWALVPAPTKRWTIGRIADVNRDQVPDVIGASEFEPDIDVLAGTRSLDMPPFSIPTSGSVTNLVVGDFDFDANDDIAFVQARPASTEREIAIAYGRALAMPPESPRPAGRLDGIRQVFVTQTGLTITSQSRTAGTDLPAFSLAVLLASGERLPVAPLLFTSSATDPAVPGSRRELTTRALVATAGANGGADLIGLVAQTDYPRGGQGGGKTTSYGVWVAVGTGPATFAPPQLAVALDDFSPADKSTGTFLVQMTAGDLDGDGKAELVSIGPEPSGKAAAIYVLRPGVDATGVPAPLAVPDRQAVGGMRAQIFDVDGDGKNDLVAILRDTATKLPEVSVFFGDGTGKVAAQPVVIKLPVAAGASSDDYAALGFAAITTGGGAVGGGGGARRELAIVTPRHAYRALVRRDRGVEVADATAPFGALRYGSAVAAGDFDGDGVEDLAIADQGSIRIARQKTRLP